MMDFASEPNLIDIAQAARLLGISQSALTRWIRQGGVPCRHIRGESLFEADKLKQWAKSKNMVWLDGTDTETPVSVDLVQALFAGGVYYGVSGSNSTEVLEHLASQVSLPEGVCRDRLLKKLLERETMASTGLGNGIAFPHPRQPLKESIKVPMIATCFMAVDQKPVFVMFLMLSPSTQQHLKLLAQMSFCMRDEGFLDFLHEKPNLEALCNRMTVVQGEMGRI